MFIALGMEESLLQLMPVSLVDFTSGMAFGRARTPRMATLRTILIIAYPSRNLWDSDLCFIVKVILFWLNRARQVGRVLSTGKGFFLSFCPSERGEGLPSCGCPLFSPRFRVPFCFISYYNCMHLYSCWISLLNKRAAPSEHATAYGVWLLLL